MSGYKKASLIIIIVMILLFGISPLLSLFLNKPVPVSAVRSYSMEPVLTRGDLVIIMPTKDNYNYSLGQVVVFRSAEYGINEWTMHRIVGGSNCNGFITQGDANPQPDQANLYPLIQPGWIAGIAISIGNYVIKVPILGYVVLFFGEKMRNPFLLSVLLMLLALFILCKPKRDL